MNLPTVLAGPIVRRAELRLAAVWVALSKPAQVELSLRKGLLDARATGSLPPLAASGTAHTRRLGARLHLCLVTTRLDLPDPPLDPGSIYSYDLEVTFDDDPGSPQDLAALGLLDDAPDAHLALGYVPGFLPSFVTPPAELAQVKLAHASCRRLHGPGEELLGDLDDVVERHRSEPLKRPQALFLTGDQIYADDVPAALLLGAKDSSERTGLTALGRELFGLDEEISAKLDDDPQTTETSIAVNETNFPAALRARFIRDHARMSSHYANSHLISLGEYCAMYLVAWNREVWPELASPAEVLAAVAPPHLANDLTMLLDIDEDHPPAFETSNEAREHHLGEQEASVLRYRASVREVRRLLANVATYMILDDHEVTDDWNLTERWRRRVHASSSGRAIVRSGLVAYAFFQAWGNDPLAFESGPGLELLDQAERLFPSSTAPSAPAAAAPAQRLDELLGLLTSPPAVKWSYNVDWPQLRLLAIDTRTRRRFRTAVSPPGLLDPQKLDEQIPAGPLTGDLEVLVLVSAAPVLGLPVVEELLQELAERVFDLTLALEKPERHLEPGRRGRHYLDNEAWSYDPGAFDAFLKRLASYGKVVCLSGDVHYGTSSEMTFWPEASAPPARIAQFTSSGAKNSHPVLAASVVRSLSPAKRALRSFSPQTVLAWDDNAPATVEVPADQDLPFELRLRLRRKPVRVPAAGWPAGTTARAADYAFTMAVSRDSRPESERPQQARIPDLGADLNGSQITLDDYKKLLGHHAAATDNVGQGREVLLTPNVALVEFELRGNDIVVRQELLARPPEFSGGAEAYLVHEVNLSADSSATFPKLETEP
jgi:hypothetical protein